MPTPQYDGTVYDSSNIHEEDKRLFVQFYAEAVKNETRSAAEGRPIFDEVPMVKIITPGSRDVMITRASKSYQERFPKQWEAFTMSQAQEGITGTRLEQVPFLTVGQIAELKALNVYTLEQLANIADNVLHRFMGAQKLKQQAQAYLLAAFDNEPIARMQAELEKRDLQIATLTTQVEALSRKLTELSELTA
jgi:hypothetical protein